MSRQLAKQELDKCYNDLIYSYNLYRETYNVYCSIGISHKLYVDQTYGWLYQNFQLYSNKLKEHSKVYSNFSLFFPEFILVEHNNSFVLYTNEFKKVK